MLETELEEESGYPDYRKKKRCVVHQIRYSMKFVNWKDNWESLTTYFAYPKEIRTLIYTTNPIESLNRQLKKVTKNRGVFLNDMALMKLAYLAINNISKKWKLRLRDWDKILAVLMIEFDWVKSFV